MEFANQYGINLGAIDQAVSARKTAEQNIKMNDMKMNALTRQDTQDIAIDKAEQDYLKDPKTAVAQSIAQKVQWGQLDDQQKKQTASALKLKINQHGQAVNSIMGITDPVQQKAALQQMVSSLEPAEQQEYAAKYGTTPEQWQENLPHTMNDLLVADGGLELLQKQAEAKTKHENVLEEKGFEHANKLDQINALYGNKADIEESKNKTKIEVASIGDKGRQKLAEYKKANGGGKPTVLEMKAAALVDGGDAKNVNEAIRMIIKAGKETNVDDPIYGKKTITSKPTFGNALKPPPPLVRKKLPPLDVNKYTK
jgi:hypothetical protein